MANSEGTDPGYSNDSPFNQKCIYCDNKLYFEQIDRLTQHTLKDFISYFKDHVKGMQLIHGWFDKNYFKLETDLIYEATHFGKCFACGWWNIYEAYWVAAEWQVWQVFYGLSGIIKNLDTKDLSTPLCEIRSYLVRNYEARFNLNPKIFEQAVTSVFRDLGYNSVCTAYSHDGGIDVILSGKDRLVGIQVKRSKNKINVEQIRSFLGALLVNNVCRGIYVSAGDYQSGCNKIAYTFGIKLINGDKFYNALKAAQIVQNASGLVIDYSNVDELFYNGCFEMNSL